MKWNESIPTQKNKLYQNYIKKELHEMNVKARYMNDSYKKIKYLHEKNNTYKKNDTKS